MTSPPVHLKVDQDSSFQVKVWMAVFTLVQMSPMVCFNLTKPAQCKSIQSIGLLACQSLCVFLRFKCYQEVGFLVLEHFSLLSVFKHITCPLVQVAHPLRCQYYRLTLHLKNQPLPNLISALHSGKLCNRREVKIVFRLCHIVQIILPMFYSDVIFT